jgi:hypothetical protein
VSLAVPTKQRDVSIDDPLHYRRDAFDSEDLCASEPQDLVALSPEAIDDAKAQELPARTRWALTVSAAPVRHFRSDRLTTIPARL